MMGDFKKAMKEKMLSNIKTYGESTDPNNTSNSARLQKTNKNQKSKLSLNDQSINDRPRATLDINSSSLKSALHNLKADLTASTPDMLSRKANPRMSVQTPSGLGFRAEKSPVTTNEKRKSGMIDA